MCKICGHQWVAEGFIMLSMVVDIVSSVGSMAAGVVVRPVFASRAADGMPEFELAFEDRRVLCKRRASAVCRNNPALGPWAVTARRYSSKVARKVHPQRLHEGGWRARRGGHLRHVSLFSTGSFKSSLRDFGASLRVLV